MDIGTGICAALPDGCWGLIVGRSSMMRKFKLHVVPAVIDAGFRGELRVLVVNQGGGMVRFSAGDRIGQMILVPIPRVEWVEQAELPPGSRGERGFGSSGLNHFQHVASSPPPSIDEVNLAQALAAIEATKKLTDEQLYDLSVPYEPEKIRSAMIDAFRQLGGIS